MCEEGCGELREQFRCDKFGLGHSKPHLFVTSQCLPNTVYIIWVVFWALFYISTLAVDIFYNVDEGGIYFIYLTNWSYILQYIIVFTDLAVVVYVHGCRKDIISGEGDSTSWYMKLLWLLFNINSSISVMITILYYALLDAEFSHGSINKHLLNAVYTLLTFVVCAKPVQLLHVYQPVIYSVCYLVFSVIWHYTGNDPVYSILDWNDPGSTARTSVLVAIVAVPVMHLLMFSLYTFRVWISAKWCGGRKPKLEKEVTSRDVEIQLERRTYGTQPNTVHPEHSQ